MIAVTGMGVVAPMADSAVALWERVMEGLSPASVAEEGHVHAVCAVHEPLDLPGHAHKIRRGHRSDRCVQMVLMAAMRGWEDAGLSELPWEETGRVGVVAGSSRGPVSKWAEAFCPPRKRVRPSLAADTNSACLHGSIAALFAARGTSFTVSASCASGAYAIALGASQILAGTADVVIAAASDAPLHKIMLGQFHASGILSPNIPPKLVCQPFDREANGTVLGEGAGCLIMESMESARCRGARIHGILSGWGLRGDGALTSAEAAGDQAIRNAVKDALTMAGVGADKIGYINAHGTDTRRNDDLEMEWIHEFDAERQSPVPFGSTKAATGHCLGATPIFEAALCLEALKRGQAPPSVHCQNPHPNAPRGLVIDPNQTLTTPLVMSNSLGFWGSSASLIFGGV
jgi:3-oxoacyl-[acyl-carrier-protein] synthase II